MIVNFAKMPVKAYHRKKELQEIIDYAEDRVYLIVQVDYNNGLIRLEQMKAEGVFINLYSTTLTVTVEYIFKDKKNKQFHYKQLPLWEVKAILDSPKQYIIDKSLRN